MENFDPMTKQLPQSCPCGKPIPGGCRACVGGPEAPPQPRPTPGRKDDGGKLDITLVLDDMPHAIEAVAEVCQWAITKKLPKPYERGSWQYVEDFQRRYRAALNRHQLNKAKAHISHDAELVGPYEPRDAETGLMELAHIATDAMFMLEMACRKAKGYTVPEGA
jgi:hypothetical protein